MGIFSSVKLSRPKRTVFDLSHEVKTSFEMAKLVPFLCQEVVPGDSFRISTEIFLRFAPLIAPVLHRVNVYTHFFFVPNRLIWDEWEDFITGGEDGMSSPVHPVLNSISPTVGSLPDYLGIPTSAPGWYASGVLSALPFRAYQTIFNEYYRDENLHPKLEFSLASGIQTPGDTTIITTLRNRAWEKDYFTSALPWTQRGPDVQLPLSGDASIITNRSSSNYQTVMLSPTSMDAPAGQLNLTTDFNSALYDADHSRNVRIDPNGTLKADMSSVSSATVNDLRRAIRLQKWFENNAKAGYRYAEQLLAHFGVKSSDARLQRPEYLGGGKSPVVISEVMQTSSTDSTSPQANPAGRAISVGNSHSFKKYFEEHGFIIGIISVLPRTCYQQGVSRQFLRRDKFDYYFPEFAHLGEQPVYDAELYADNITLPSLSTFGYQSRYAEYKTMSSRVCGAFRMSLDFWHLGRIFSAKPALNNTFVQANPSKRIFAVSDIPDTETLYGQLYIDCKAIRPMPRFGTPEL